MKPCLNCGAPTKGARCPTHERAHEAKRRRTGKGKEYNDPDYRVFRTWVRMTRPVCHLCGKPGADSVDHVIPIAQGGTNFVSNLRPAHSVCNYRKGAQ